VEEKQLKSKEAFNLVCQGQEEQESLIESMKASLINMEPELVANFFSGYLPEMQAALKELSQLSQKILIDHFKATGEAEYNCDGGVVKVKQKKQTKITDNMAVLNAIGDVMGLKGKGFDTELKERIFLLLGSNAFKPGAVKKELDKDLVTEVIKDELEVKQITEDQKDFLNQKKQDKIKSIFS